MTTAPVQKGCYKLIDFDNIIYGGLQYSLPSEVIHNLQNLQKQLGINGSSAPSSQRGMVQSHKPPLRKDWKPSAVPYVKEEFKKTVVVQEREGIEKDLAAIRISLNKISGKNYDTQSALIFQIITPYIQDADEASILKIAQTIFDISSSNTFLSELNARLYKQCIETSDLFLSCTDAFLETYKKTYSLDILLSTDMTAEQRIKQNDKRKAMTLFIYYLMKENILSTDVVFQCMMDLFDTLEKYMECANHVLAVDEIVENVYQFVTLGEALWKERPEWDTLYERMASLSEIKSKDKPSLSSRAIFKFKDLLDFL
jgi:hypothetical protein